METIRDQYEMTMKESPIKTAIIKLKQDKYKGFEFYYGNVSMPDDLSEDSGNVELSYDFSLENSLFLLTYLLLDHLNSYIPFYQLDFTIPGIFPSRPNCLNAILEIFSFL